MRANTRTTRTVRSATAVVAALLAVAAIGCETDGTDTTTDTDVEQQPLDPDVDPEDGVDDPGSIDDQDGDDALNEELEETDEGE